MKFFRFEYKTKDNRKKTAFIEGKSLQHAKEIFLKNIWGKKTILLISEVTKGK